MKKFYALSAAAFLCSQVYAQAPIATATPGQPAKGNYQLAGRYSPAKIRKMVFSTAVDPHWLKGSDRFWYMYETSNGKKWYIVDPSSRSKNQLFDSDKLAAAITQIVRDPFDGQHLPIENLKFTKDEKVIQFELKSTIDQLKKDRKDKKAADSLEKKTFYFQYNLENQKLVELKNYEKVKPKPMWASIAPDSSAIIFARKFNLYWMDKANYKKALKNEDDSTIVEHN
jgi:dipeptidyl-peptidase-4